MFGSRTRVTVVCLDALLGCAGPTRRARTLWYSSVKSMKRKDPHAVALGRKGGKKGGKARWASVSPEDRSRIARKAALIRWQRAKKIKTTKKGW